MGGTALGSERPGSRRAGAGSVGLLGVNSGPVLGGWLWPGTRYLVGSPSPRVEHRPLVLRGLPVGAGSDPLAGGIAYRRNAQRRGSH